MLSLADWLPPLVVGITFTLLGAVKMYGALRGIEGGCDKPLGQKLCGTCPSWTSGYLRLGLPLLFLTIGLYELSQLGWVVYAGSPGR